MRDVVGPCPIEGQCPVLCAGEEVCSTVTQRFYAMACAGDQPVTCTGGNDAVVCLYGGEASFR